MKQNFASCLHFEDKWVSWFSLTKNHFVKRIVWTTSIHTVSGTTIHGKHIYHWALNGYIWRSVSTLTTKYFFPRHIHAGKTFCVLSSWLWTEMSKKACETQKGAHTPSAVLNPNSTAHPSWPNSIIIYKCMTWLQQFWRIKARICFHLAVEVQVSFHGKFHCSLLIKCQKETRTFARRSWLISVFSFPDLIA